MTNQIFTELQNGKIVKVESELLVVTFKEEGMHIAFIPSLNICSHNKEEKKAIDGLTDAVKLFFQYWSDSDKLEGKLKTMGWNKMADADKDYALAAKKTIETNKLPILKRTVKTKVNRVLSSTRNSFEVTDEIQVPISLLNKEQSGSRNVKFDTMLVAA